MAGSSTATLSPPDLLARLSAAAPPHLLDVRTPAEFETSHIAGAYNIPLDVVRDRRAEIVDQLTGDVVFVCRSGQRAAQAAELLNGSWSGQGYILEGGILDWQGHGYAVDRGTARWELERQVRLVAGSIVLTSVLGSAAVPKLKWLAAAIGGGLTFAAVSNTCAMASVLAKLPYNRTVGFDSSRVVSGLRNGRESGS